MLVARFPPFPGRKRLGLIEAFFVTAMLFGIVWPFPGRKRLGLIEAAQSGKPRVIFSDHPFPGGNAWASLKHANRPQTGLRDSASLSRAETPGPH